MSRREGVPPQGGHALSRPFPMWPRMAEGDAPREKGFSALGLSLSLWKAESSWFSAQASGRSRMLKEAKSPTQAFGMNAAPKGPGVQGTTVHPPQLGVGISFRTRRVCWRSRNSWESCLCGCSVPACSLCLLPVWWGLLDSPCPPTRAYTLPAPPCPSSCCPREPFSCAGSEVTLTVAYLLSFLSLVCLIHTRKQAPFRGSCIISFLHEEIETQRGLPMLTRPGSSKTGFKSRFP